MTPWRRMTRLQPCAAASASLGCLMSVLFVLSIVTLPNLVLAFPDSSISGDTESDTAPWEAFGDECNWENEYCASREVVDPDTAGADDIIPAMPCTQ
eukprot:13111136-Heterocapsa_arctica.AAC.1